MSRIQHRGDSITSAEHGKPNMIMPTDKRIHVCQTFEVRDSVPDHDSVTPSTKKSASFWLSFIALNTTTLIVSLDSTALSVAIPKIVQDLHGTTLEAFWTSISFILAQVVAQPIYTTTSDVLGRKIPLYAAFILFLIGSIVFAVSQSMRVLIVGRILQGLGGGGLDVLGEIILADMTTLKERPMYLSLYALPMAVGGVCGPLIGAAFSEFVNWRWIGWINLPIIVVGLLLTIFFMKLNPLPSTFRSNLARLDWIGMALFTTGCTLVALPLSWTGAMYPWSSWRTIVPFVTGFMVLGFFGWYESKPTEPVFPYRIFNNRTAVMSLLGAAVQGALLYSVMLFLPLFFQAVKLQTPFRSAVSVLPTSIFIIVASVVGVAVIEVSRRYRLLIIINYVLLVLVGTWATWRETSTDALLYGLQIIPAIGIGTLFMALNIPMTASVQSPDDMGLASGILVSFRLFGALIGLSICSSAFNNVFEHQLATLGTLPPPLNTVFHDAREAIFFIPYLRSLQQATPFDALHSVIGVYRTTIMVVFLTLAGISFVGLLASLFIRELTIESEELGRQQLERESE